MQGSQRFPVMVLAYNEEAQIGSCIDSIFSANPGMDFDVYVMANGCTDGTEDVVRAYEKKHPDVHLVSIKMGDKCNAWNVFIHDTVPNQCPGREIYFFMDGDARSGPSALANLAKALREDAHAHASSAPPGSGRNKEKDAYNLVTERALVANLYALRGSFVDRLKDEQVRLPLKLEGDDGLLGALVKWDLAPGKSGWDDTRIHPCTDAWFEFDPVPMTSVSEWRKYWRRLVRYGRRRYEFQILGKRLPRMGLAGLPVNIQDVYGDAEQLSMGWAGIYTFTHALALREMRSIARSRRRDQQGTTG
ncbi:MAG: glycosyltransferase family A protein [Betaproteobacteria bacterium]